MPPPLPHPPHDPCDNKMRAHQLNTDALCPYHVLSPAPARECECKCVSVCGGGFVFVFSRYVSFSPDTNWYWKLLAATSALSVAVLKLCQLCHFKRRWTTAQTATRVLEVSGHYSTWYRAVTSTLHLFHHFLQLSLPSSLAAPSHGGP